MGGSSEEEAWSSLEGVVALLCDTMSSSKGLTFPSSGSCSGGVVECGLGNLLESEQEVGGATKECGGAVGLIADITVLKGERGRRERRERETICTYNQCIHVEYTCIHAQYTCIHAQYTCIHAQYTCIHAQYTCTCIHVHVNKPPTHIMGDRTTN